MSPQYTVKLSYVSQVEADNLEDAVDEATHFFTEAITNNSPVNLQVEQAYQTITKEISERFLSGQEWYQ